MLVTTDHVADTIMATTGLEHAARQAEGIHLDGIVKVLVAASWDSNRRNREVIDHLEAVLAATYSVERVDEFHLRVSAPQAA